MLVLAFVCYPIARLLDHLLGEHDITRYKNDQLKALVNLHSKNTLEQMHYDMNGDVGLSVVQTKIITGALDLSEQTVETVVTPFEKVFSISIESLIDAQRVALIRAKGYSRIPVYYGDTPTFIMGILIVKTLIGVDIQNPKTLRQLCKENQCQIRTPLYVNNYASLGQMLNYFKQGNAHLAIVSTNP